ncbi:LPXTG cell wall anchor domain-containing protein, partial [Candidatus Saccharibacteria bacterium]|nr:LPXTG cell wall anchor domain-containing protein [Candidatus Saccharibacteria bacterium]
GAVITETTIEGQHALKVTYTITDNGQLDLDPATGKIVDPVGLAVTAGSLASTGESIKLFAALGLGLVVVAGGLVLAQRKADKK